MKARLQEAKLPADDARTQRGKQRMVSAAYVKCCKPRSSFKRCQDLDTLKLLSLS